MVGDWLRCATRAAAQSSRRRLLSALATSRGTTRGREEGRDCPRLARVDPCVACGRHDAGEDEDGDAVASLAEEQRIAEMKVRERGSASCCPVRHRLTHPGGLG